MEYETGMYYRSHSSRAASISLFIVFMCLASVIKLSAAISLQTPSTDVVIAIDVIPSSVSTTSLLVPICDLTLFAKHPGCGKVFIDHTPLSNKGVVIMYQLVSDQGLNFEKSEPFIYRIHGTAHEEVSIGRLWAHLVRPIPGESYQYTSTLWLNLVLEK